MSHQWDAETMAAALRRHTDRDVTHRDDGSGEVEVMLGYHEAIIIGCDPSDGGWYAEAVAWDVTGGVSDSTLISIHRNPRTVVKHVRAFVRVQDANDRATEAALASIPEE